MPQRILTLATIVACVSTICAADSPEINRYKASTVSFHGRLWFMGGTLGSTNLHDVWSSANGSDWTLQTDAAGWSARNGQACVVFHDKIWILGGSGGGYKHDVWSSADGINWTLETGAAGWSPRFLHSAVVFDDKIWVMGGYTTGYLNDVWSSPDGITWTQATPSADWSPRTSHTAINFAGKMWVLGGYHASMKLFNDVWSSEDGVTWTQNTAAAAWPARSDHASVVFNGRMWVLGGYDGGYRNDVWSSQDGVEWVKACNNVPWKARSGHTAAVLNRQLVILGGIPATDAWATRNGFVWNQVFANPATLKVKVVGGGSSTPAPGQYVYTNSEDVILSGAQGPNSHFAFWSINGSIYLHPQIAVRMNRDTQATAFFWSKPQAVDQNADGKTSLGEAFNVLLSR